MIIVCVFSGCVSLGRNFTKIAPDSIIIGNTTKEEIIQKLGRPKKDETELYNDESVNTIEYYYVTTSKKASPFFEGVIPIRKHIFHFWNDKLVGHRFFSNFMKDNTYFAKIHLLFGDSEFTVDSRPSDAIAVALRTEAPIFASGEVLHKQNSEELERWLENLKPEDFGKSDV